ncbi:DedA family protein [Labrys portucalensis]|uniref:DedA family protein n=1 Tax=Labrys neptuniae TaxID=376174 RepID=A0ABV6ZKL8_9HYPH|nr:DedA family protein [Labrys neptuniae]MDT3377454.1 DedA family protein [Labrys neptuniae]
MEMSPSIVAMLGFGLAGITCLAVAEKFLPVIPSYILLMLLGMGASDVAGLATMVIATTAGSTIGSVCWYGLGRTLGSHRVETVVSAYGRFVLLPLPLYLRLVERYRRNQFWATLVGHTIPTVRVYLGLPAGVFRLELRRFILATLLGSLAWNTPFLSLGFMLQGSDRDPLSLGLLVAILFLGGESAILWAVRQAKSMAHVALEPIEEKSRGVEAGGSATARIKRS